MQLQFFTVRQFQVSLLHVNKVIKGAVIDENRKVVIIKNRSVVDFKDAEGKKMLRQYSKECELWGEDAVKEAKKVVTKSKSSKRSHERTEEKVEPKQEVA